LHIPAGQRERLFHNVAAAMQGVPAEIIAWQVEHFRRADPAYGEGVEPAVKQTRTPPASAPTTAADAVGQAADDGGKVRMFIFGNSRPCPRRRQGAMRRLSWAHPSEAVPLDGALRREVLLQHHL
jgi:hypothetical protein